MTMPAWGEVQIRRFKYRLALFQRRGMAELAAEALADRLATRDFDRDDRRVCLECKHMQHSRQCFYRYPMSIEQLARCDRFDFQTP
jgi:hypothetical protein